MNISPSIVEKAKHYAGSEPQRMENLLQELQEQKTKAQQELEKQREIGQQLEEELGKIRGEVHRLEHARETCVEEARTKLTPTSTLPYRA